MKLLFDENLSRKLVRQLEAVWDHARLDGLMIATKDTDFHQRCFLYGPPPKVVWIRAGNCTSARIASPLRSCIDDVRSFAEDNDPALLVLG